MEQIFVHFGVFLTRVDYTLRALTFVRVPPMSARRLSRFYQGPCQGKHSNREGHLMQKRQAREQE